MVYNKNGLWFTIKMVYGLQLNFLRGFQERAKLRKGAVQFLTRKANHVEMTKKQNKAVVDPEKMGARFVRQLGGRLENLMRKQSAYIESISRQFMDHRLRLVQNKHLLESQICRHINIC